MKPHQRPLIGKRAKVTQATNKTLVGVEGTVRDETKNTITIDDKKIIKEHVTITIDNETINGKTITKSIPERIKGQRR